MPKKNQAIQINTLEIMMEQNAKEHSDIKEMMTLFGKKLDDSLERMEKKLSDKANKWTEKAWIWAFTASGVVVIGLLVRWVIFLELK